VIREHHFPSPIRLDDYYYLWITEKYEDTMKVMRKTSGSVDASCVRKVEPKRTFVQVINSCSSIRSKRQVKDRIARAIYTCASITSRGKIADTFMKDQHDITSTAVHDTSLGRQVPTKVFTDTTPQNSEDQDESVSEISTTSDKYIIDQRKELEEQLLLELKVQAAEARFQNLDQPFCEGRDPEGDNVLDRSTDATADLRDDDVPNKIESDQNFHELNKESDEREKSDVDEGMNISALSLANKQLNENEVVKNLLRCPATKFDNNVLVLAGTLVSSNRYIVEFMKENGLLTLPMQKLAFSLADNVVARSKKLCDVLLNTELSIGETTKAMVISCLNDIVSGSNELSSLLEQGYNKPEAIATDTTVNELTTLTASARAKSDKPLVPPTFSYDVVSKEEYDVSTALYEYFGKVARCEPLSSSSIINDILRKRDLISRALYDSFQNVVQKKSIPSSNEVAQYMTDELRNTIHFLTDPEKLSSFLCTGATGIFENGNVTKHKASSPSATTEETLTDTSSFLDFIDSSGLSMIFTEDEEGIEVGNNGYVIQEKASARLNLDNIFKRINLKPGKKSPSNDHGRWGWSLPKKQGSAHLAAKEKRKHLFRGRNLSRSERRDKKKDSKTKDHAVREPSTERLANQSKKNGEGTTNRRPSPTTMGEF